MKQTIKYFDFDGCITYSPEPETGRVEYLKKTGKEFPHIGWWSKPASLDLNVFDIKLIKSVDKVFQIASADPNCKTVLLTNRIHKVEDAVRKVLEHHNYKMDLYTFRAGAHNKGQRIVQILKDHFPNATNAEFYDDDPQHLLDAQDSMKGHHVPIKLFKVDDGHILPFN